MIKELAPIILFVYNRPDHTRQTVEALQKNEFAKESVLYVFSDGPKENATQEQLEKIQEVRKYIHSINGFKSIHIEESENNKGLANSIIFGVTKIVNEYGRVIVLEDDIVTHPFFLNYMNDCLNAYQLKTEIFMIGGFGRNLRFPKGYKRDVYMVHRSNSWGWATWKDRWAKADWDVSDFSKMSNDSVEIAKFNRGGTDMFPMLKMQMDGEINSWAIRWDYCLYKNDAYCVNPVVTFCENVGFDGSGVHCGELARPIVAPMYSKSHYDFEIVPDIKPNMRIEKEFHYFQSSGGLHNPTFYQTAKNRIYRKISQGVRLWNKIFDAFRKS